MAGKVTVKWNKKEQDWWSKYDNLSGAWTGKVNQPALYHSENTLMNLDMIQIHSQFQLKQKLNKMAACSKYMKRFRTALQYRSLPFPKEIIDCMGKRSTSDRSLDKIINGVLHIIEPPNCTKSHCEYFTIYEFCNCSKELVPGKCKLHLEYLKRKREREESIITKRTEQIPGAYLPLSDETKRRILSMSDAEWEKEVKKFQKHLTGKTH